MLLNRAWIESHIPHQGRMCLIDQVLAWDAERIRCVSGGHRATDHPLRAHGRLGIASGIELASQTMAIHGALSAGASGMKPSAGFLASVRGVRFHATRLDDLPGDLICEAVRLASSQGAASYEFVLACDGSALLEGRATVVLDADRASGS
jgi:predicted hotdog family 3-hydroxylacyl-ACP dehydratase